MGMTSRHGSSQGHKHQGSSSSRHQRQSSSIDIRTEDQNNQLRRETPFICNIRFKNDLPEIPNDPMIIVPMVPMEEIKSFHLTSLDKEIRQDLPIMHDQGFFWGIFDAKAWDVPERGKPQLTQADKEILGLAEGELLDNGGFKSRPSTPAVPWMQRPTYGFSEINSKRAASKYAPKMANAQQKPQKKQIKIKNPKSSFEDVKRLKKHPKKSNLSIVEERYLFPDEEEWLHNYVNITFDGNPVDDYRKTANLHPNQKEYAVSNSAVKTFSLDCPDMPGATIELAAFLLPKNIPHEDDCDIEGAYKEGELRWIREYKFQINTQEERQRQALSHYLAKFTDDGTIKYIDLNASVMLKKRKRQEQEETQTMERPSKVIVNHRQHTHQEMAVIRKKMSNLYGQACDEVDFMGQEEEEEGQQLQEEFGDEMYGEGGEGGMGEFEGEDLGDEIDEDQLYRSQQQSVFDVGDEDEEDF
eukprot:TRINITY_DN3171_c2_g1_i1.p1 TRINITY_DN3171_c2_g1~~TRINITY_DN3171_c2_g1_i1.p1  ORF type:complete len:470 (-),score=88.22 TRINITY_DN3171_c2_g1_i1:120-1529(-)